MTRVVRIGNAQAFWGDRSDAAARLLRLEPQLDYLTLDYLAEVSMSILAHQRGQDPTAGFARDFLDVVASLAPYWNAGGRCRLITNAGGLNPRGCAEACAAVLRRHGCRPLSIAIVTGDDVLELAKSAAADFETTVLLRNSDSHESLAAIASRLVTANAYLGAAPIVAALERGADLVITGRVADPSLAVAACVRHFGWSPEDWDRVAGATVAGHLIECGTQVTGGICTDWLEVPDPVDLGFPIVEVAEDGSCIVTKPGGSGGQVTEQTVKEQLLYEILDPDRYLSPDVTASFAGLRVEAVGANRVRVSGAKGRPAPSTLKVSATYRDGYRAAGTLTIVGRDALAKAQRCGEIVLQRVAMAGFTLRDSVIECLGAGACLPDSLMPPTAHGLTDSPLARGAAGNEAVREVVLRVAVEAETRDAVEQFTRELMPQVTAGPQGTTGYAEGRPRVHRVYRYWPCLIPRADVTPRVELLALSDSDSAASAPPVVPAVPVARRPESSPIQAVASATTQPSLARDRIEPSTPARIAARSDDRTLRTLAYARSGDKGIHANIGILARSAEAYDFLVHWLTAARVAEFFRSRGAESVERFELPNLAGLNFVVRGILRQSLRTDSQGKALGQILLEMPLAERSPS